MKQALKPFAGALAVGSLIGLAAALWLSPSPSRVGDSWFQVGETDAALTGYPLSVGCTDWEPDHTCLVCVSVPGGVHCQWVRP